MLEKFEKAEISILDVLGGVVLATFFEEVFFGGAFAGVFLAVVFLTDFFTDLDTLFDDFGLP